MTSVGLFARFCPSLDSIAFGFRFPSLASALQNASTAPPSLLPFLLSRASVAMASRQTVASVARVGSAALVRLPQRRAIAVIGSAGTKTSTRHAFSHPLTPSGFARTSSRAVGARAYSQSAQNKIWSFEDVCLPPSPPPGACPTNLAHQSSR